MIKLDINEKMKESHLNYYKSIILPEIEKEYTKQTADGNEPKSALIKYCKEHWTKLATGTPHELRSIIKDIQFKELDILLKTDKDYVKHLHENVFGYKNFASINISYFDFIIKKAKEKTNENRYCEVVRKKIPAVIRESFPGLYDVVGGKINAIVRSNSNMTRVQLEDALREIPEFPTITLENYYKYRMWEKDWNPYKFVFMMNLRTCPYCNRQYITPIFRHDGKMRADLDHFWAKSEFPYLAMSIYNLVPSCKFCNSSLKGTQEFDIDNFNPYEDSLDKYMIFDVQLYNQPIEISVKPRENCTDSKKKTIDQYNKIFKLDSTYESHKNIASELGEKMRHYNPEKIMAIKNMLGDLVGNENQIRELIVGRIPTEKELLNEPLNKFKKDILEANKYFK